MKRTIYIINAILFMGCCLLVSTTKPSVNSIHVNNIISYVNSVAITKADVIDVTPVEVINTLEEETIISESIEDKPKEEVVANKEDDNVNKEDSSLEVDAPTIYEGYTFTGKMSGYGSDIGDYTASQYFIGNTIYYSDSTYGDIRILSGDSDIPFGTIVEVNNSKVGNFVGIVLDTGGNVGFDKLYDFDLLFETSSEALNYGVSYNVTFKILRVGY